MELRSSIQGLLMASEMGARCSGPAVPSPASLGEAADG